MSLPIEYARSIVAALQTPPIPNFIAQAKAKQILQDVHELPKNFPRFTRGLDERITIIAYRMLAAGCSFIEQGYPDEGYTQLHSAADLLESTHRARVSEDLTSGFHSLVGAMAFYACGHYSRAFVLIKDLETVTLTAAVIASFLRKDSAQLILRINDVLLVPPIELEESSAVDDWALSVTITRAVALVYEYSISGEPLLLEIANSMLVDAMLISEGGSHPTYWWMVRLLRLMFDDYKKGSLWTVLPHFFDPEGKQHIADYVSLLALSKPPITELWKSQLACVSLALDEGNRGGVVNLRTSAGKTRVAELAILKTLKADAAAKVLYLAPFRSLAFEIERTFGKFLGALGFSISHLYGGSSFSGVDKEMVNDAHLMIATPEKAKAMLRAAPELFENVKLVVIDEGHLLGENERNVRNELFLEHLRLLSRHRGARILLMSAVLPNAYELAIWIGGSKNALAKSQWKPSEERFGLLRWSKGGVQIEWKGSQRCFNPHFVEFRQVIEPGKKHGRKFPKDKTEAVAATAVRLAELGPVLIFAGQARWVPSMARAVLLALGDTGGSYSWPEVEWNIFEAVCREELGSDSIELLAASLGVVCHSNKLPPQVRIALEKLMAAKTPRVIIATTTLGQGVNIGISSVIVSQTLIGRDRRIGKRDFWNICGRAGRAFVDSEGKMLFAIDTTKEALQVRRDEQLAAEYLDIGHLNKVESGLLMVTRKIRDLANNAGVSFDVLLELIANGDFEKCGKNKAAIKELFDLVDDQLLALHLAYKGNDNSSEAIDWVEGAFRDSLAAIQAKARPADGEEEMLISLLKARTSGVLRQVSSMARRAIVASGLPLSVGVAAFRDLDQFRVMVDDYLSADPTADALSELIKKIESWARENAGSICKAVPDATLLDRIRSKWIGGIALHEIQETCGEESIKICTGFYGYELPWLCHSVAQKFNKEDEEFRVEALALTGLLLELGLPTEASVKVFLAGVRSRAAAVELGRFVTNSSISVRKIRDALLEPETVTALSKTVSPSSLGWLHLLSAEHESTPNATALFPLFRLDAPDGIDVIHIRKVDREDTAFLCSSDGRFIFRTKSTEELPFNNFSNDPRFVFVRDGNLWRLHCRDVRVSTD